MGLYGPWGSGKTTALNFVKHFLSDEPEKGRPAVVYFNPWWFSGREDLILRFFAQMQVALRDRGRVFNDVRKKIAAYAEGLSKAPVPHNWVPGVLAWLIRPKPQGVTELKAAVEKALAKRRQKVLVIVDDLDRLTSDEMRELFTVIKAVADFPHVTYLVAFDKTVATAALQAEQGVSGEAYLEKIIQVPFELPLPDKTAIRRLLFERLDLILADTPEESFDQTYWANTYYQGIDHFIETPRDVVRLANTLRITYSAVRGEVNPVDFIAIEAIRVFSSRLYDVIRKNEGVFTGASMTGGFGSRTDDLTPILNTFLEVVEPEDRDVIKRLLLRLFPKLQAFWGTPQTHHGSEWLKTWRKDLRVCSPDIFRTYFRLAVPEGAFSNVEVRAILSLVGDVDSFGDALVRLAHEHRPDGSTRARAFLERLEDYTNSAEIPLERVPSILEALFEVGDDLIRPEDERLGLLEFGNDIRIGRLVHQLIRRFPDQQTRFEILRDAMIDGRALATIVGEVSVFGQEQGKHSSQEPSQSPSEWVVGAEHLRALENLALERIRLAARENTLFDSPRLIYVLYRWGEWGNESEPREWVQQLIESDEGLLALLEKAGQRGFVQSLGDVAGRRTYRLNPDILKPFLDPDAIVERVRQLAHRKDLSEIHQVATRQFIKEYEAQQRGEDPDSLDDEA